MTPPNVLLKDDFRNGLDLAGTWALLSRPPSFVALFTLLDGGLPPADTGLVSLEPPYAFPTAFAGGPNLFGQGAELRVERFEITSVNES